MHHQSRWRHGPWARSASWIMTAFALVAAVMFAPRAAQAQIVASVPFNNGFIGATGANPQQSDNVTSFTDLNIARIFFIQSTSDGRFQQLQGNDILGTIRIVGTAGNTLDIPASAVWRQGGGTTELIGFIPRLTNPVTWTHAGGSFTITDGANTGGSNIGGYFNGVTPPAPLTGTNQSGNAAGTLGDLNDYLDLVNAQRPNGPVTVNSATVSTSTAPTITGTVSLGANEVLTVIVNGVQYSAPTITFNNGTSPATWSLTLPSALAAGTYEVAATITDQDGYTLSDASVNELTVANVLTIGGSFTANDKEYDGLVAATGDISGLTLSGSPAGVTIASATLAFQTSPVGTGKTVVITGITLGGANAGSYTVDLTGSPTATAAITAKQLTIGGSFTASNKTYDATAAATIATNSLSLTGLVAGDAANVSLTGLSAAFADANAANGKTVSLTAASLSGTASGNYTVTVTGAPTTTANITPKQLTISGAFTANNKPFDGTTAATIASNSLTLAGLEAGDVGNVSLTGLTAAFADAAVGNGKTVSLTAASLSGTASGNYSVTVTGAPTTTANITSATLTIGGSFTASDKVYNGTVAATGNTAGLTLSGSPAGVTIASVTLEFQTAAVGTGKTVVITGVTLGGANGAQYSVDLTGAPTATAAITPKQLTISGSFTANNKPFDGTTAATIASNSLTLSGLEAGDVGNVTLTGLTAAFANAAVGNGKTVSLTAASLSGTASGNYSVTVTGAPTTTANITSAALTIGGSFTANNKLYDGTVAATGNTAGLTLSGSPAGVTIASVTLAFQTASAGIGKTVVITGLTLGGANAASYTVNLAGAPTATAAITPRPVTIGGSFTADDKLFDNTTSATLANNALTVVGAVNGDVLSLANIIVAFTEATAGQRTVTISSATLQGAQAANYTLSLASAPTATANILAIVPPGPPRNLLVVPGDGQLTVSFDLPLSEGCRPVSGFVLEYSANNGATWTRITYATRSPSPIVIRPVTNNVPYIVRVAASNECGLGQFAQHAPVTPIAAVRDGNGNLQNNTPGTSTVNTNGTPTTITTRVVQDTTLVMTGPDFTLSLRSVDTTGAPVPIENLSMQFERGGRAVATGTGFAPGSIVSLFLYGPNGQPILLGTVVVRPDGTFDASVPIPSSLAAGNYTLQVNGVDTQYRPRTAQLGVQIIDPPAELVFTAVPSENLPAVGDTISITLTVTNVGRGPAIDVVIPRAFSEPGFRVVAATPQQGSYNATTGTWTIPRIEAGANAQLVFTVIVLPSTSSTGVTP